MIDLLLMEIRHIKLMEFDLATEVHQLFHDMKKFLQEIVSQIQIVWNQFITISKSVPN